MAVILISRVKPILQYLHVEGNMRNISVKYVEFEQVVWEKMLFQDISYLELWWLLSSVEWNILCNFGRGHFEEYNYEIILNLDQWFRRCRLKIVVQRSRTSCAIL